MSDKEEKRKFPRIDSLNLVSVQHFDKGDVPEILSFGRTLDLSEGGIKLEVTFALPLFSKLSLTIALKDCIINVQGEVVFLAAQEDALILLGLKFTDLSVKDKETIRNYLSTNSGAL